MTTHLGLHGSGGTSRPEAHIWGWDDGRVFCGICGAPEGAETACIPDPDRRLKQFFEDLEDEYAALEALGESDERLSLKEIVAAIREQRGK